MEEIEMKFPGQSGPFRSFPTHFPGLKKREQHSCHIPLLALLMFFFFILTIAVVLFHPKNTNDNNNNNSSNAQYTKNESTPNQDQNQTEIFVRHNIVQNLSLVHHLHKQMQRLNDQIDFLSKQIQNVTAAPFSSSSSSSSTSTTTTTMAPPIDTSKDEGDSEKNQNDTEDSTPSGNSPQKSILQPISSNELVDVIGKAKAHILMQIQGLDDFVQFHYNQNGTMNPPCQNLPLAFHSYSTSADVETFGTCVRIYSTENCIGDSVAFYPKILPPGTGSVGIGIKLRSIGRCMTNELDESFFKIVQKTPGKKEKRFRKSLVVVAKDSSIPTVPDSLAISTFMALDSTSHFNSMNFPITDSIDAPGDWQVASRTILLRAVIQYKDLKNKDLPKFDISSVSDGRGQYDCKQKLRDLEKNKNHADLLGFFVSRRFSPQESRLSYNVFYQSSWNLRHLVQIENKIIDWLQQNQKSNVEIRIQINYKGKEMRPEGFVYWVKYNYKGENPKDVLSDTVQIYYLSNL